MKKPAYSSLLSKPALQPIVYCLPAVAACTLAFLFPYTGEGYAFIYPLTGAMLGLTAALAATAQNKPLAYDPLPMLAGFVLIAMGVIFGRFVTLQSLRSLTNLCRHPQWNFLGGILLASSIQPMAKKDWKRTLIHLLPVALIVLLHILTPRSGFNAEITPALRVYRQITGFLSLLAPFVIGLCLPVRKPQKGSRILLILAIALTVVLLYAAIGRSFSFAFDFPFASDLRELLQRSDAENAALLLSVFCGMTLRKS